ncbi:Transcriptional regulator, contains XRE-family HTH domain [Tissierella praeacuta DSM 18095]|uniref:Transcriptional regulator, contains XRE-family HTH domain n=1 Tax=Tissierella praeacuta DSM 18095 TaxID=1123404 RepID=A0A1M4X9S1_9FIRM|nr:helix-turn-helix transcriptional regulator [Tissierella praeacuta]SHE90267.1 Transcriptional regulator, contains XRE-family HTH domain [Tissierella praeacuta DSM 18095]SUP02559.1 transcriptional repressor DicA [Tissierella praeacuta]
MKFGEKLRDLRKQNGLTQAELAEKAGISLRTVNYYESGTTYPKNREIYTTLANILDVDVHYLRNEGDEFITRASEKYGYRGAKQAEELVAEIGGLFAGGELSESDKDAVMQALQQAYWDAKKENKKYTPNKYRKDSD